MHKPEVSLTKRVMFGTVLILIPFALLFAIEFSLRAMGFGYPILYREHVGYRYALEPNQSKVRLQGAHVTIGSTGLRSKKDWQEDTDFRVLFIGDSVTWGGTHIDDADVFAIATCDHIEELVDGGVTCGNAGVNSYGTDNMAMRIRYKSFNNEDVIVAVVLSIGTLRGLSTVRALPYFTHPIEGPLPAFSEIVLYVFERIRVRFRFGGPTHHYTGEDPIEYDVAGDSLDRLFAELSRAVEEGKSVLLVHTPDLQSVVGAYSDLDRFVLAQMADSGLPFLEMRQYMVGEDAEQLFQDPIHLSEAGHALYAQVIAERLASVMPSPK